LTVSDAAVASDTVKRQEESYFCAVSDAAVASDTVKFTVRVNRP
jgi:hypothetical protein